MTTGIRTRQTALPDMNSISVLTTAYDIREPNTWWTVAEYTRDVNLDDGTLVEIRVPIGFRTDMASVPKLFWNIVSRWGVHAAAAVSHDWMYENQHMNRKVADKMFLTAMKEDGVGFFKRWAMYSAVRVGGSKAWRT